jgi:hypothetical protein
MMQARKSQIDLNTLNQNGKIKTEIKSKNLYMTVLCTNPLFHCKNIQNHHYLEIPECYRLPLRIDFTVKIDVPAFYVHFGNGHIKFGTHLSDNKVLDDICEPQLKPKIFNNYIPMNTFTEISLIYDFNEMQILVNNEVRYYSNKERYMKSNLLKAMNAEGFSIKISCEKRTECNIKSISITEYSETAGIVYDAGTIPESPIYHVENVYTGKPIFEACIANIPEKIKNEIIILDDWLRKLKPVKFKRTIDKNGNKISYVASDYGLSYAIHPSFDVLYHTLQWYIITKGKPEFWHRKANEMEDTLNNLVKTDSGFAQRMFDNLSECVGGFGHNCLAKTPYTFNGKKKISCHGKMWFKMCISDFSDVKRFISTVNEMALE